jgi:limonene-1,2-epoxide hydrolase
MTPNERIVTDLCGAFDRMDADELIQFFTPDAVYHNVPLPPSRGREEIYASLRGITSRFRGIRTEILRQISVGDLVMNERIDYFTFDDRVVALPIAGVFELRDGKVAAWRDYFDLDTLRRP